MRDILNSAGGKSDLRIDIQALRGVAVLLVVLYHAGMPGLSAGYLGVDVFFVISGFLITGILVRRIERNSLSLIDFYYMRAKRLLPSAYVVIAITLIAAPYFLSKIDMQEMAAQVIGAITFTANIALWMQSGYFDGSADTKPFLHFWSLAIEEQYYLLMPIILVCTPRRFWMPLVCMIMICSLSLSFAIAGSNSSAAFFLLPTRAWELALGSLGALASISKQGGSVLSLARFPAIAVLMLVPVMPTGLPHPGLDALLISTATLVVILGYSRGKWEEMALFRVLGWFGGFSYSLYLVHWPIFVFMRAAWIGEPPTMAMVGGVALSILAGLVLYHFVEKPFRRGFINSRTPFICGIAIISIALCFAPQMLKVAHATSVDYEHIRRRNYGLSPRCAFKEGAFTPGIVDCRSREYPQVIVWGNSYAMALAAGLNAQLGDVGLEQATSGACGPMLDMAPFAVGSRSQYDREFAENCIDFNRKVVDYVASSKTLKVVVVSSPFTSLVNPKNSMLVAGDGELSEREISLDLAIDGIRRLVGELRLAGKRVVIVAPPPTGSFDIGECLERRDRGQVVLGAYSDCEIPVSVYRKARHRTLALLERLPQDAGVEVIWPSEFLCDEVTCKTQIGSTFLYRDEGHLSYEGSMMLAKQANLAEKILHLQK